MSNTIKKPTYFILLLVMVVTSLSAMKLRPTHRMADDREKINLEKMLPKQFEKWRLENRSNGQIVNPEVKQQLRKLYSESLSRTYVSDQGELIMLTIAYGADQSDAKQVHYPEVCYPSQGFEIKSTKLGEVNTRFGNVKVKHLYAVMGQRHEPITYWATIGNKVVIESREAKLEQLKYGFKGNIPDGLLFRVSSIGNDTAAAYKLQEIFISDLIKNISPRDRLRLAGIKNEH